MKRTSRILFASSAATALLCATALAATTETTTGSGQAYPTRPIRVIIPLVPDQPRENVRGAAGRIQAAASFP